MTRIAFAAAALLTLAACGDSADKPEQQSMGPMGPMPLPTRAESATSDYPGGAPASSRLAQLDYALRCFVTADTMVRTFDRFADQAESEALRQEMLDQSKRTEKLRAYYDRRIDELTAQLGVPASTINAEGQAIVDEFSIAFDALGHDRASAEFAQRTDACRNSIPAGQGDFNGDSR